MATHHQLSPGAHRGHQSVPSAHMQTNGHSQAQPQQRSPAEWITTLNEQTWINIGHFAETLNDAETAKMAYGQALRFNNGSLGALTGMSTILRGEDKFEQAVEYLRTILKYQQSDGEAWSALGHCYLMMDELQQAYSAYQQALYHLRDPKEPKLWYGIGILYDRYGSLEHAEEAFSQVMRMEPGFEKANEIYFRLGIIYKQQAKFSQSLECFKYIVQNPPNPLTQEDIWFQIGHVYEQQKDFEAAKDAYRRVLQHDPNHAKVLQQLGWLYHQQSSSYESQEQAIEYLEKSVNSDQTDAQSWYLLGRCYMSQTKYPKAYEAYQQAVYRDGRNPTFWCSIGVLYYQINQYRDALDAYSRAIRLNPNISEVWYDLGTLYESCNNQTSDALDAYQRAAELDPHNTHIKARLELLRNGGPSTGMPNQGGAPLPQDVHPQAYQPASVNGPPQHQWGAPAPLQGQHPQNAPAPLNTGGDWNRRLADIHNPPPAASQPAPVGAHDSRDGRAAPAVRPPSPRRDQQRYPEQSRPGSLQRPQSPSARGPNDPAYYPGSATAASLPPPQSQASHQSRPASNRIVNPNYSGPTSGPSSAGASGPAAPSGQGPLPPYPQQTTTPPPPPQIKPIIDGRPPSGDSSYPHSQQPYTHHADSSASSGIANGAPAPAAALAAAEAAARAREESQPSSGAKRGRGWEDPNEGGSQKKQANEDSKAKLDDHNSRRPSPPEKEPDTTGHAENGHLASEMRRADEAYRPSELAHHPQPLNTTMHAQEQEAGSPRPVAASANASADAAPPAQAPADATAAPAPEANSAEKREAAPAPSPAPAATPATQLQEPAARKMDVDEDYDDSGDEKKPVDSTGPAEGAVPSGSPNPAAPQTEEEQQQQQQPQSSPSQALNGNSNSSSLPKVETAA